MSRRVVNFDDPTLAFQTSDLPAGRFEFTPNEALMDTDGLPEALKAEAKAGAISRKT